MKSLLALSLAFAASTAAFAQSDSPPDPSAGAKLVDEIAKKPGIFHQNCSGLDRPEGMDIELSFAGRSSHSEHEVSAKQFAALRKERAGAIKALEAWLQEGGKAVEEDEYGYVKPWRSKLTMMVDLNATACLPLLATYAQKLRKEYDEASELTEVDWEKVNGMEEKERNKLYKKVAAGDRLGDTLSAIVAILRSEKFEPLLKSQLEKDGEAGMAKAMKESWNAEVAKRVKENGGEVPAKERDMVLKDAVSGEAVTLWVYPKMKVSKEAMAEILGWVEEFSKLPAEKRLDEKGMTAWPVNR
ncbi:MAG: hypothetical protein FD180_2659 [Planctomycetota bacterium]|nr:MAG: hypothetical protein FD180_2659 [Planctomycetota bacterium]